MRFRIAPTSQPWTSGQVTIDFVSGKRSKKKFIILHIHVGGRNVARVQLKSGQIYQLVNSLVDALESGEK